ncbi:phage holin family protein [Marivita sp. S0852]|uniref:phage holin family protein n=1 Tax=Marivita sp. S0852 TaxID=3373893 RepID=UPI003981C130
MSRQSDLKHTPSLVLTAFRQFTQLMQDEVALAKAEVSRNVKSAGAGLAMIGVAAILALVGLNVLADALIGYLALGDMSLGTAALIVGGVLLALAIVLVFVGRSKLSSDALRPDRTLHNTSKDIQAVKEATHA